MRRHCLRPARWLGAFLLAGLSLSVGSDAWARPSRKLHGPFAPWFRGHPTADGSRRMTAPRSTAPLSVRFASPPTPADLAALEAAGGVVARRSDGSPRVRGHVALVEAPEQSLAASAAVPRVQQVSLDALPFKPPPPLDLTAALTGASDTWGTRAPDDGPLTGRGITVCDVDSEPDIFHPLFFRADGGAFGWVDVDGDGNFTPGVDGVDPDGDGQPTVLRVLDALLYDAWGGKLGGKKDGLLEMGYDWLYADLDGSEEREFGPDAGFGEAQPSYGEPFYVVDDVNANGVLDLDEKLIALGTSKFKAAFDGKRTYRRGQDLIELPVKDGAHGSGAASIIAGGNRGLNKLVGIAPDAELLTANAYNVIEFQPFKFADFCLEEGAQVVLHEYATWQATPLDGSTDVEGLIDDSSADGVAHVTPLGNLSTADKMAKTSVASGGAAQLPIAVPPTSMWGKMHFMGVSVLWRDPQRVLSLALETPSGVIEDFGTDPSIGKLFEGKLLAVERTTSSRGTVKVDIFFLDQNVSASTPGIEPGTWKLHLTDAGPADGPAVEVLASVMDDLSGWGKGIHFSASASEEHLVGDPATADHGFGIAAFTAHAGNGAKEGERAFYSGRGRRFDGARGTWLAAPANPVCAGWMPGESAVYQEFGGTSGASPHVAGAAALLLQAKPDLDGDAVRSALTEAGAEDEHTGKLPNDDWGFGKLRIYEAVYGKAPPGGTPPTLSIAPTSVVIGTPTAIPVDVADADEPATDLVIELDREYDGTFEETLAGPSFEVSFPEPGRHVARLRVTDSSGKTSGALATIEATTAPPADPPPATPPGGDGDDGCSTSPGRARGGAAWLGAGLLALALGARRRRR
jgi:subtilisin family serine protease